MKLLAALAVCITGLALSACTGDYHLTRNSNGGSTRVATTLPIGTVTDSGYISNRVYQITRVDTVTQERAEWRARGETIRRTGDTIEFTELGSGRYVSFTGPHQIETTGARTEGRAVDTAPENPRGDLVASAD